MKLRWTRETLGGLAQDAEQRTVVLDAVQHLHTRVARISREPWQKSYLAQPEQKRLYRLAQRHCPELLHQLLPGWIAAPAASSQPHEETQDE